MSEAILNKLHQRVKIGLFAAETPMRIREICFDLTCDPELCVDNIKIGGRVYISGAIPLEYLPSKTNLSRSLFVSLPVREGQSVSITIRSLSTSSFEQRIHTSLRCQVSGGEQKNIELETLC